MPIETQKRTYQHKKVKINRDRFFYSPNLLDLSQQEISTVKIDRPETWWTRLWAKFETKKLQQKNLSVDFLAGSKSWQISKAVSKKIVREVNDWELPKFLDKLLYSKNSKVHRGLAELGLKFEKHPWLNKFKKVIVFLLVCLVLLLPIQGIALSQKFKTKQAEIMTAGMAGYDNFKQAQINIEAGNFSEAQQNFRSAEENFITAEKEIGWWRIFIPITRFVVKESSAYYLLESAKVVAQTGEELTGWVVDLKNDMSLNQLDAKELDFKAVLSRVQELANRRDDLENRLDKIENYLAKVDSSVLDPEQVKKIEPVKQETLRFLNILEILPDFLGQDDMRRYLVIFQNSNELRATGGFMGSLALIDVNQGKITKIEIPGGGPYDLRAGLKEYLQAPQPLWRVKTRWEIQDANWWPDFPTSAKKIAWFYENSDQPTVDGVIAVNSDILPKLLKVFGPITLDDYGKTITTDNFYELTQQQVEVDYDKEENQPKQFIADLFFKMIDNLTGNFSLKNNQELEFVSSVLKQIDQSIRDREIQIYLRNEDLENKIIELGMAGDVKKTDQDYLMIVNTNIGGGKTDEVVSQNVFLKSDVQGDNSIINTLKITRKHNGIEGDLFTGLKNKNYLRVYVPQGAVLIETSGFSEVDKTEFKKPVDFLKADEDLIKAEKNEYYAGDGTRIYEESGKTVFANWLDLDPGQTKTITIKYKLPFSFSSDYNLYLQKQSGSREFDFSGEVNLVAGQKIKTNEKINQDLIWQPDLLLK